ncbi:MAG: NUDIX hydrolase [Pseudomonadales bacterium]|jgi:8-oxo-dGTP pyrophosphatase MutT (NUDIX family)|nr:NUDIX hydrolase [Pseudomonadales bacterium]MCP5333342.1 NUDIX hydrolase [Pseudomonadales bacterium]HMU90413.1 NUDIX hydrolase [Pseudomonadales bacterium]HMW15953.1 NUDIX hydrolase [Pseudomonadales bacterium]HMW82704.1 NUDIX hydrolase [Pseudomonadales bacterium]
MDWYPHATVATIVERDGHFLLVEESEGERLVINQPAGHLDQGETLAAAAVRETLEETGWEVTVKALLGLYTYTSAYNGISYLRTCFIAEPLRHHPERPLDTGILRTLWLTVDELRARRDRLRSPLVLRNVEDYLRGKRYPLDFIHEHSGQ